MSYLSLIFALIMTWRNDNIPQGAWLDYFLNNLVRVEEVFLTLSWWIFGITIFVAVLVGILALLGRSPEGLSLSLGCGCVGLFLLLLPLMEWITLMLARNMAAAVGPNGIVDAGRFWVNLAIFILLGAG